MKDKLFFFFSQEWNHEQRGAARSGDVPTAAEKQGDFSNPRTDLDNSGNVCDPTPTFNNVPLTNISQVPTGGISPVVKPTFPCSRTRMLPIQSIARTGLSHWPLRFAGVKRTSGLIGSWATPECDGAFHAGSLVRNLTPAPWDSGAMNQYPSIETTGASLDTRPQSRLQNCLAAQL